MHDQPHQYNNMGEQRISTIPASIKILPHTSLLDNHSSCIIEKYGDAMEVVHQRDGQDTTVTELFPTVEAFNSQLTCSQH